VRRVGRRRPWRSILALPAGIMLLAAAAVSGPPPATSSSPQAALPSPQAALPSPQAASQSPASSPEELLVQGNDLYAHGDYAGAARKYRSILDAGIRNSAVDYNLGNACFRQNRIGEAILFYEKALKLDPTDVDARENLRYANLRIRDRIPEEDPPLLLALLDRGLNLLRLEQVTHLFVAAYLASMVLFAAWIAGRQRRWGWWVGVAALVVFALSLAAGGWMISRGRALSASDKAIVLSEKVDVLSGPGSENTLLASVHEGTKVLIHNRREEWVQVTLPDGRAGWMRGDALGII
jgi:tetratricopeptide (TPR) repeat protein